MPHTLHQVRGGIPDRLAPVQRHGVEREAEVVRALARQRVRDDALAVLRWSRLDETRLIDEIPSHPHALRPRLLLRELRQVSEDQSRGHAFRRRRIDTLTQDGGSVHAMPPDHCVNLRA